jgi:ribosomal protein L11 methyltransferase
VNGGAARYRVRLDVEGAETARTLDGLFNEAFAPVPVAVATFEAGGQRWQLDLYFDAQPDLDAIVATITEAGVANVAAPQVEAVPDENWVARSQEALPPVFAGRFVIHGSHDATRIGRRANAILIDAGEAFGTAHHATTEGCLIALDGLAQAWVPRRVLDLGCGSGVLAIAAGRLWPRARVIASDIDPVATTVASANMRANGAHGIEVVTAIGFAHPRLRRARTFDLIIANILAKPLIALAPDMRKACAPGGFVVLSGLLSGQAAEVSAAYLAQGFRMVGRRDRVGWSTLVLRSASR